MDLIHLCLEGIRQEQEQEFPCPVVRFFSNLVDESPTILFFFGRKGIYIKTNQQPKYQDKACLQTGHKHQPPK